MKINKQSIQYRAVNTVFKKPSNNLCVYFWQLLCTLTMGIGGVFTLWSTGYVAYLMWKQSTDGSMATFLLAFPGLAVMGVIGAIIAMAIIYLVFLAITGVCISIGFIKKSTYDNSVVKEYIKAKKDKICPRIEFED